MTHWPDNPEPKPDACEHAAVILEALGGDYVTALETLPVYLTLCTRKITSSGWNGC